VAALLAEQIAETVEHEVDCAFFESVTNSSAQPLQ
jgi:hypothetical protein